MENNAPNLNDMLVKEMEGQDVFKVLRLELKVRQLLDWVAATHGIEDISGFRCPYMRNLAEEIKWTKMPKDCKRTEAPQKNA